MDKDMFDKEMLDKEMLDKEMLDREMLDKELMLVHQNKETNGRYACTMCGHNATTKTSLGNW